VYGYLAGTANLTCHAEAEPAPRFNWYRGDDLTMPLEPPDYQIDNTRDSMSVLKITSLTEDIFGEFTCRASNQHGSLDHTVTLREGQKPAVPTVRVTSAGSTQLTLEIGTPPSEVSADGYRAQYKTVDAPWPSAHSHQFKPGGPHVITNLQPDTTYQIRVASRNQAGYGDFTASLEHRTAAPTSAKPTGGSQPLVLELLSALIMAALLVL